MEEAPSPLPIQNDDLLLKTVEEVPLPIQNDDLLLRTVEEVPLPIQNDDLLLRTVEEVPLPIQNDDLLLRTVEEVPLPIQNDDLLFRTVEEVPLPIQNDDLLLRTVEEVPLPIQNDDLLLTTVEEMSLPIPNDDQLLRAVDSGNAKDVMALFKFCNLKITSFSNHVLNQSVIKACHKGHAVLVQFLLQDNAQSEVRDDNGNTPLLICSMKGMSDIVKFLLMKGADVNSTNNNGDTSLILANSREVINILISQVGIKFNHQNSYGYTALMSAVEAMNLIKAKQLILAGACPESEANQQDMPRRINIAGEDALQIAQRKGVRAFVEALHCSYLLDMHPLHYSVVNGNLEMCKTLLRYGFIDKSEIMSVRPNLLCAVLNALSDDNNICVGKTETEIVTRLCQSGLNVNECSDGYKSPLDIVMDIGNYDLAEILCNHGLIIPHQAIIHLVIKECSNLIRLFAVHGGIMNQMDEHGHFVYPGSAMDVAFKNSQIKCAIVLLYHGAKLDLKYALNQVVDSSNVKMLKFLLAECTEKAHSIVNNNPKLFHKAVTIGELTVIELLLQAGADINRVYDSKTPIMNAGRLDVIRYLVKKGACVNRKSNATALIEVLSWEHFHEILDVFEWTWDDGELNLFLKFGANLEATDNMGRTALIKSAYGTCHQDIMNFLLDKGSNVNARNSFGQSALIIASNLGYFKKTRMLLNYGANVNLQNNDGVSPLHEAVDCYKIAKVLLKHGADVNAQDNMGNTPLQAAVTVEDPWDLEEVLELLVASGANVNHTNKNGMSALLLAIENLNPEAVFMLLEFNADVNIVSINQDEHKSAMSILLNKWYISSDSQSVAVRLLEHSASTKYVRPDIIHKIIVTRNINLVHGLIVSGLAPTDVVLKKQMSDWPTKTLSPLSVCWMKDNLQLAKYLIKNWYLTKTDIKVLSRGETILENASSTTCQYLREISAEPLRLELLSFISVSTAIGSGRGREEKVKRSQLPTLLQEYLLFKKADKEGLDESEDVDNNDNLNFSVALTRKQLDNISNDSEFYKKDELFSDMDGYFVSESSSDDNEREETDGTDNSDSLN